VPKEVVKNGCSWCLIGCQICYISLLILLSNIVIFGFLFSAIVGFKIKIYCNTILRIMIEIWALDLPSLNLSLTTMPRIASSIQIARLRAFAIGPY